MWHRKLSADLATLGYIIYKLDACVFNRTEKDHTQTTLLLHVDDMKIICDNELNVNQAIGEIEITYPGLTKQRGRTINYLGMTFDYSVPEKVKMKMKKYVRDVHEGCSDMTGTAESPAQSNLFSVTLVSLM